MLLAADPLHFIHIFVNANCNAVEEKKQPQRDCLSDALLKPY